MVRISAIARLLIGAVLLCVAFGQAGFADDARADAKVLDELFAQLRTAPDPMTAYLIDQQIWIVWSTPDDPVLAERMNQVFVARGNSLFAKALTLLDGIVADYPDYAEGWNQRATIFYLLQDFDASLADIDTVLKLEPRHFGALTGRALIYLAQGKRALALKDISAAAALHPFLSETQLFPELLKDFTRI